MPALPGRHPLRRHLPLHHRAPRSPRLADLLPSSPRTLRTPHEYHLPYTSLPVRLPGESQRLCGVGRCGVGVASAGCGSSTSPTPTSTTPAHPTATASTRPRHCAGCSPTYGISRASRPSSSAGTSRTAGRLCATGNHDERVAFAKALGSGHLDPAGGDRAEDRLASADGELAASSLVDGHRIVTLDSLVPGKVYGYLGAAQLDWLRELLRTPAPHGTTVVLHHPPVTLDNPLQRALGLGNPADLADAVRGSDVRLILCGHFHLQIMGYLESVPVWVTPGVVNRIDLTGPAGTERAVRGASATLVDLDSPHSPLFHTLHARDPRAGETVYELDEARINDVIARESYK
ncbi:metallophosphoesterase [Streptomyces sp. NRRL WC-3618]|uniref:metallophosphoesterase n=1 Tax=Streptomyces sp. NRRL WC-3618 TaxID=1519490 RepID=UPI002D21D8B3|nr:metallophosphoesterase [Streptomyces sp. NRRL WC-3618]